MRKNKGARAARILEQFRAAFAKQQLDVYITIFNDNLNIQRQSELPIFLYQPGFSVLRQLCRMQTRWSHRKIIATSRQMFISKFFMFEFKNYTLFRKLENIFTIEK